MNRNRLKWKIRDWFYWRFPIYINLNIFKCYKVWWKVKDVFLKPKIEFKKFKANYWWPYNLNRWISIECHGLGWKQKFQDYCFETNPWFGIKIFNWGFLWQFIAPPQYVNDIYSNDHIYWEAILGYLYGGWDYVNKESIKWSLYEVYNRNIWMNGKNLDQKLTLVPYLTDKGLEILKDEIIKEGKLPGEILMGQRKMPDLVPTNFEL